MDNLVIFSIICAVLSADITMFGQFMISRPIFCGPLFGYILGDIYTGLWLGMIIEMMWVNAIPLGVAVPVDLTMITSLGVIWSCSFFKGNQEAAIFSLAMAIPFAYLYKEVDLTGRLFNTKIMHWVEKGVEEGKEYRISIGIYLGLILFLIRASIIYGLFLFIGGILYKEMFSYMPLQVLMAFKKAWFYLPLFGFGAILYNFKNIRIPFINK